MMYFTSMCDHLKKEKTQAFTVCTRNFQLVSIHAFDLQLTVIYISPQEADLCSVAKALEQTMDMGLPQMIVGDFNFHSGRTNSLSSFLQSCNLFQLIKSPTHKDGNTLDHLYISESLKDKLQVDVQFKYFSDHAAIQIKTKN